MKQVFGLNGFKIKLCCLTTCLLQKKRIPVKIERGTGGMNDVDISWIPQENLNIMSMFMFYPYLLKVITDKTDK